MKKWFKQLTAAALVLTLALSLAACGASPVQRAQRTVENALEALQDANFAKAAKYVDLEALKDENIFEGMPDDGKKILNVLFDKLEYEIISAEQKNDEVVYVAAKISTVDMMPVLKQYTAKALEQIFAHALDESETSGKETMELAIKIFEDLLAADDLTMVTNEVKFKVVKQQDGWKVDADATVARALLGGLKKAATELAVEFVF